MASSSTRASEPQVAAARRAAHLLLCFRGVLDDAVGQALLRLLDLLEAQPPAERDLAAAYGALFALLAREVELYEGEPVGDAWQNHLLDRLLVDENAFSLKAQRGGLASMGEALVAAARHDLALLRRLFALEAASLAAMVAARLGAADLPAWAGLAPVRRGHGPGDGVATALKRQLAEATDWSELVHELARHYARAGAGVFARFRAFRWRRGTGLEGVAHPDPIRLDEIIGYEREREVLLRNTEQFVAGYPANNILLYGDRGTGKSSTVKALLNHYGERGLRLIEVAKADLDEFPRILALLRDRRERFILFVDDLSFDEGETHYKDLKAVLEGSLEARPANVLLYATTNRRHIVQERHSDRRIPRDDDLHAQDGAQEKLSLADRFGITLTFLAPDQARYLRIVEGLAAQRGLAIAPEELQRRALRWAEWHNGRSGRTARQFVDQLEGELALARDRAGAQAGD